MTAQAILYKCLLCLGQSNLRTNASKAHTACRTCTRSTFSTTNDDEVGLCLCHTSGNGSNATFGNQLDADRSRRIDVLQVEDELRKVFNTVDVVVRWRRDEADARNGVTRLGYNLVHLEAGQLSAFARLCTLRHLNLNLLSIHKVFCRHAKPT